MSDEEEVVEWESDNSNRKFVGATASFDHNYTPQPLKPVANPHGVEPNFDFRGAHLAKAAKSTCYVVSKRRNGELLTGTAFFVGPTTLLTAGHVARGVKMVAQHPGTLNVERNAKLVIEGGSRSPKTFDCIVKKTLYKRGKPERDIAVLDCSGSGYQSTTWLEVVQQTVVPGSMVDVLGYPGTYDANLLSQRHGWEVSLNDERNVMDILPRWQLTVSYGPVIEVGVNVRYKLSTMGGMSGGPVVVNGKAVGIHIGGNVQTHNRCVTFTGNHVAKLVRTHVLGLESSGKWGWISNIFGGGKVVGSTTSSVSSFATQSSHSGM